MFPVLLGTRLYTIDILFINGYLVTQEKSTQSTNLSPASLLPGCYEITSMCSGHTKFVSTFRALIQLWLHIRQIPYKIYVSHYTRTECGIYHCFNYLYVLHCSIAISSQLFCLLLFRSLWKLLHKLVLMQKFLSVISDWNFLQLFVQCWVRFFSFNLILGESLFRKSAFTLLYYME